MDTVISGRAALGSRKEVNDSLHFVKSRTRELNDEAKIVGDIDHHIFAVYPCGIYLLKLFKLLGS